MDVRRYNELLERQEDQRRRVWGQGQENITPARDLLQPDWTVPPPNKNQQTLQNPRTGLIQVYHDENIDSRDRHRRGGVGLRGGADRHQPDWTVPPPNMNQQTLQNPRTGLIQVYHDENVDSHDRHRRGRVGLRGGTDRHNGYPEFEAQHPPPESDYDKLFKEYCWCQEWKPTNSCYTSLSELNKIAMAMKFEGDFTQYKHFRSYFKGNIHDSCGLSVYHKSGALYTMLSPSIAPVVGAKITEHVEEYAEMLLNLDYFYGGSLNEAYLRQIHMLPRVRPTDQSSLEKMIGILREIKSDVTDGKETLNSVALSHLNDDLYMPYQYSYRTVQNIETLIDFLSNHYRNLIMRRAGDKYSPGQARSAPRQVKMADKKALVAAAPRSKELPGFPSLQEAEEQEEDGYDPFTCAEESLMFVMEDKNQTKAETKRVWKDHWPLCPACQGCHWLANCYVFASKLSLEERSALVKGHKRCFKCLAPGHLASDCKWARKCDFCGTKRHHSWLHPPDEATETFNQCLQRAKDVFITNEELGETRPQAPNKCTLRQGVLRLRNPTTNQSEKVNVLLDSCANISTVHMGLAKKWNIEGYKLVMETTGVEGLIHNAVVLIGMITLESLDGRVKVTCPIRFSNKPAGDLKFEDWRKYASFFGEFGSIQSQIPEPAAIIPSEPEIGAIIGTDLNCLMRLDMDGEGPVEIGGGWILEAVAQKLKVGWTVSGITNPQKPNEQDLLKAKVLLSSKVFRVLTVGGLEGSLVEGKELEVWKVRKEGLSREKDLKVVQPGLVPGKSVAVILQAGCGDEVWEEEAFKQAALNLPVVEIRRVQVHEGGKEGEIRPNEGGDNRIEEHQPSQGLKPKVVLKKAITEKSLNFNIQHDEALQLDILKPKVESKEAKREVQMKNEELLEDLQRIWSMDRFEGDEKPMTPDEERFEKIFRETFRQLPNGRCQVGTSWKVNEPNLPRNFEAAKKRYEKN